MLVVGPMFEFSDFGIWILDLSFSLSISGLRFFILDVGLYKSYLRLFLTQSDWSVENSLSRLKPESGFLTQWKKG